MNHVSIWSGKYELTNKSKNHTSSFRDAMSSFITTERKQALLRNSLKDEFVSSKLDNNLVTRCGNVSEYQNFDKNILDIYSCQDGKLIASPEHKSEQILHLENNTSPELSRQRNPFVKRVSELTTSPSLLSSGNCRQRGRNLMRIRRTIIDENTIVESRYFSKKNNEEHDVSKLENNEENNSENKKCNAIANVNDDIHNVHNRTSYEEPDVAKCTVLTKNYDASFTHQNVSSADSYENIHEKSYSDEKISEISSTILYTKINDGYVSDNLLSDINVSSSSNIKSINDLINHEKTGSLREDLHKWSSTKSCRDTPHKKVENFKKQSTPNLVNINLYRQK